MLPLFLALAAGTACRCPQLTIEQYFDAAEIVVVARADEIVHVQPPGAAPHLEVRFTLRFPVYRGRIEEVRFATPIGSASCGVDVRPGETYIVFASRGDPRDPALAWFTTCSGSRRYEDPPFSWRQEPFLGLPPLRIIARLEELAEGKQETFDFHTSPACWNEPRIAHTGAPPRELRDRIRIDTVAGPPPDTGGITSPNGAYRFWTGYRPEGEVVGFAGGFVFIDNERPHLLRATAIDARAMPQPIWISEKLLFVRVVWGTVQFTDLIIDVERGVPIYEEAAIYGRNAFEQFHQACNGRCPCNGGRRP